MQNRKGEIATALTLGLVVLGAVMTLATSVFTNRQKNIGSNPQAVSCPSYQCTGATACYNVGRKAPGSTLTCCAAHQNCNNTAYSWATWGAKCGNCTAPPTNTPTKLPTPITPRPTTPISTPIISDTCTSNNGYCSFYADCTKGTVSTVANKYCQSIDTSYDCCRRVAPTTTAQCNQNILCSSAFGHSIPGRTYSWKNLSSGFNGYYKNGTCSGVPVDYSLIIPWCQNPSPPTATIIPTSIPRPTATPTLNPTNPVPYPNMACCFSQTNSTCKDYWRVYARASVRVNSQMTTPCTSDPPPNGYGNAYNATKWFYCPDSTVDICKDPPTGTPTPTGGNITCKDIGSCVTQYGSPQNTCFRLGYNYSPNYSLTCGSNQVCCQQIVAPTKIPSWTPTPIKPVTSFTPTNTPTPTPTNIPKPTINFNPGKCLPVPCPASYSGSYCAYNGNGALIYFKDCQTCNNPLSFLSVRLGVRNLINDPTVCKAFTPTPSSAFSNANCTAAVIPCPNGQQYSRYKSKSTACAGSNTTGNCFGDSLSNCTQYSYDTICNTQDIITCVPRPGSCTSVNCPSNTTGGPYYKKYISSSKLPATYYFENKSYCERGYNFGDCYNQPGAGVSTEISIKNSVCKSKSTPQPTFTPHPTATPSIAFLVGDCEAPKYGCVYPFKGTCDDDGKPLPCGSCNRSSSDGLTYRCVGAYCNPDLLSSPNATNRRTDCTPANESAASGTFNKPFTSTVQEVMTSGTAKNTKKVLKVVEAATSTGEIGIVFSAPGLGLVFTTQY